MIEFLEEDERNDPQRSLYIAKIYFEAGQITLAKLAFENIDKASLLDEEQVILRSLERSIQKSEG